MNSHSLQQLVAFQYLSMSHYPELLGAAITAATTVAIANNSELEVLLELCGASELQQWQRVFLLQQSSLHHFQESSCG
jgi:hypothetical protein